MKDEYSTNNQKLIELIRSFESSKTQLTKETIKGEFSKEFSKLNDIIKSAEEHRNNLLHHFIITWEESSRWERSAEEVWSITPNLMWTYAYRREKIFDICEHRSHKYKYIVRGNSPKADSCIDLINEEIHKIIAEYISSNRDSFEKEEGILLKNKIIQLLKDVEDNFQIRKITKLETFNKMNCNIHLPLPGDMVLYKDMPIYNEKGQLNNRKTVAIISLFAIEKYNHVGDDLRDFTIEQIEPKHKYDVQISEHQIYDDFRVWFNRAWNQLEEVVNSNEIKLNQETLLIELNKIGIKNIFE